MKYIIAIISIICLASCSPKQVVNSDPLGYSFMPKYLNLDSIGPKIPSDPSLVVDTSFPDYQSVPITRAGSYYLKLSSNKMDSISLLAGIEISPKKAGLYVFYQAEYKRLKTQLYYTDYLNKQYYDKGIAAEKLYQDEIVKLQKQVQRSWLEQNSIYIGFICGAATAILTEWAVVHVQK
jgi:hypothetical protein